MADEATSIGGHKMRLRSVLVVLAAPIGVLLSILVLLYRSDVVEWTSDNVASNAMLNAFLQEPEEYLSGVHHLDTATVEFSYVTSLPSLTELASAIDRELRAQELDITREAEDSHQFWHINRQWTVAVAFEDGGLVRVRASRWRRGR